MVYIVSYSGLLLDLFIVPFILWSKTRWYAVVALILFHRFNAEMFSIGIFPTFATAAIIVLLPPDLPRRVLSFFQHSYRVRRRISQTRVKEEAQNSPALSFMQRPLVQGATVVFVLGYISFQLLFRFGNISIPATRFGRTAAIGSRGE